MSAPFGQRQPIARQLAESDEQVEVVGRFVEHSKIPQVSLIPDSEGAGQFRGRARGAPRLLVPDPGPQVLDPLGSRPLRSVGQTELARFIDVRYLGQSYQLRIPAAAGAFDGQAEAAVREAFHAEHDRAYSYATPDEPVELVNVGLRAVGRTPKPALKRLDPHQGAIDSALRAHRPVYFPGAGFVECSVYDRYRLGAGARVAGPAIVDEFDSTVAIYPNHSATVDEDGNLIIVRS